MRASPPRPLAACPLPRHLLARSRPGGLLLGDVSALLQVNREASVWRAVLARRDWHDRLLHGSDYPLPCIGALVRLGPLVRAGLLDARHIDALEALRAHNLLLFDFALKRLVAWRGAGFARAVFETRRHFDAGAERTPS
jgi:mannonate dehydratase